MCVSICVNMFILHFNVRFLSMHKKLQFTHTLGYTIYADNLESLPKKKNLCVNTINQYSYCIAEQDRKFKEVLKDSDILLPDGIGILVAAGFLNGERIKKIAGFDVHDFLLKKMDKENGSCFYLGSSETTLKKIHERVAKDFPSIRVGSYSPPFKTTFSKEDSKLMLESVNKFQPEVLFVGMTAPKQEKWTHANKKSLDVGIICSIGAVFDFYAGTIERPGKFWRNSGLEWLGRLFKEPKRMYKRYIYYGLVFLYYLIIEKIFRFERRKSLQTALHEKS